MQITLKNLHEATAQQVFEQVVNHLLTQNRKALAEGSKEACRYRAEDGAKCAAGCLIGEDEYNPGMGVFEGYSWRTLGNIGTVPKVHVDLISELQIVHDSYTVETWYDQLLKIGSMYYLDVTFMRKYAPKEE